MTEITAKKIINDEPHVATIAYDFGENLDAAVEKFGAEVVFSNFKQSAKITAQAAMRRMLEDGKDQDAVAARMADWKPGQTLERVIDPVATLKAQLKNMDPAEAKALLKDLAASAKG